MDEKICYCDNVLTTYSDGKVIIRPSCQFHSGKKCGRRIETPKMIETPKKSWVLSSFQALIFVFICVYLTFYNDSFF